jgi:hypothetical protein
MVFTVGTFALAVLAGVIAFAAYLELIRPPALVIAVQFPYMDEDHIDLMLNPLDARPNGFLHLAPFDHTDGRIMILNTSRFSARNPACRVELVGCVGLKMAWGDEWSVVDIADTPERDVRTGQWDGGANYTIHGNFSRTLHVDLRSVVVDPRLRVQILVIEVVAEDFDLTRMLILNMLQPAEFVRRHPDAAGKLPEYIKALAVSGKSGS